MMIPAQDVSPVNICSVGKPAVQQSFQEEQHGVPDLGRAQDDEAADESAAAPTQDQTQTQTDSFMDTSTRHPLPTNTASSCGNVDSKSATTAEAPLDKKV